MKAVCGSVSGALRTDSFVYDELGNRQGGNRVANRGAVMSFSRRNNGLNQYVSWENDHPAPDPQHWGSGIFHDDNNGPSWVFPGNGVASYNALNQPVAMWSPVYSGTSNFMWFGYDPLGRCVKRWKGPVNAGSPGYNPATYFYYAGSELVQEGPSATAVDRTYVHGGRVDEIVASQVSGVWYNHHYDAQGNCIVLSNINGGLQEQYDYDAFGYPYFYTASGGKAGNVKTRFLFTGREWISDMKIYDYRARQYQPELGRFLQPDPQEFAAGDYNLYRYCHNDPINKSDPMGLYAPEIDDEKTRAQFEQLKEKSQAFRDQFKKWEGDKEKRFVKSANDPGNFKGRNQSPTKNGPGNSTEWESLLSRIASWLRGGQGRGGTIYYNPNNRATAQGRDREPIFGFGHELGHLIDIGNGNYPSSVVPSAAETRAGENTAIGWEREAQSAFGETNLRPYQ